jgi:hypothetical protein
MSMEQDFAKENAAVVAQLLKPPHLYTREESPARPSPVPRASGICAWYFDEVPPGVDIRGCHSVSGGVMLYVGIAPKEPPRNGTPPSTQTFWNRIRYHYGGYAY